MAITLVAGSSTQENSATNGGSVTITLSTQVLAGDYIVVAVGIGSSRTPSLGVTSSSTSTAYTLLGSRVKSSSIQLSVFGRLLPSAEVSAICTGTGNSSDALSAVAMSFRGVDSATQLDNTPTTSSGTGTTPTSPAITLATSDAAIVSIVSAMISDTAVTAPSSFLNQIDRNASDNWAATTGMAWITSDSTSSYTPTGWSNFTSATWVSATVALRETQVAAFTWSMLTPLSEPDLGRIEIVGY